MKKDFYTIFAQYIWKLAKKHKADLLHCTSSPHENFIEMKQQPYCISYYTKIDNEQDFITLFHQKQLCIFLDSLKPIIYQDLFINTTLKEFNFLINNYEHFFYELNLEIITPIISQLSIEKITSLIYQTNIHMGGYFKQMKDFIIEMKNVSEAPNIISYLVSKEKICSNHYQQEELLNLFLTHFNSIEQFSSLNFVQTYINNKKQPIFKHEIKEVIYVSLNLKSLHSKYHSFYKISEYDTWLSALINTLVKIDSKNLSHKNIHSDFDITSQNYSVTHIFIALKDNSTLKLSNEMLEKMIEQFFDYVEKSPDFKNERMSDITLWIHKFLLSFQLNHELSISENNLPSTKI